jgi:hypothetical protein
MTAFDPWRASAQPAFDANGGAQKRYISRGYQSASRKVCDGS